MSKLKKTLLLVISLMINFILITVSSILLFIFFLKNDISNIEISVENYYYNSLTLPQHIEIEYKKIYKKLINEYFKKIKTEYIQEIKESVENDIKLMKSKAQKEENFEDEWIKILDKENVTTEDELYEKKVDEYQNRTFYEIFYRENYESLLKGGFLKDTIINIDESYIDITNPIHIAHFSIKVGDAMLTNQKLNRISKNDSLKIFNIISRMVNKNVTSLGEIARHLETKIEYIDEIIDENSVLDVDDNYKLGAYLFNLKNKIKFYDEIERNYITTTDLINKIPYEVIVMLGNQRYRNLYSECKIIMDCEEKNECEKEGFAFYDITAYDINNQNNNENYFIRNVLFNNFFDYGLSTISYKDIDFKININQDNHYSIETKILYEDYNEYNENEESKNIILFFDNENLHFIYILNQGDNVKDFINFINDQKTKFNRKNALIDRIKNFDINRNRLYIFKYLLDITKFDKDSSKYELNQIISWLENKIKSNDFTKDNKLNAKIKEYYEKIKLDKENEDKKIFRKIKK